MVAEKFNAGLVSPLMTKTMTRSFMERDDNDRERERERGEKERDRRRGRKIERGK